MRDDLESEEELEVEFDGSTVEDILEKLDIPSEEVLVSVDGTIVSERHELDEASEVRIMDVIAGG